MSFIISVVRTSPNQAVENNVNLQFLSEQFSVTKKKSEQFYFFCEQLY